MILPHGNERSLSPTTSSTAHVAADWTPNKNQGWCGRKRPFGVSGKAEGRSTAWGGLWPTDEVRWKVWRLNHRGFCGMDMTTAQGGSSKKGATGSRKHCPTKRFQGINKRSGGRGGVREAGNVHLLCMAWEGPMPLTVFSSQLPLVAFRNLITIFFSLEAAWLTKFVVRAVALLSAKRSEKESSTKMILGFNKLCMLSNNKNLKKHGTNRGKERRQPHRGCLKQQRRGKPASTIWSRDIVARQTAGDRDHACQMVQSGFRINWTSQNRLRKCRAVECGYRWC